jgi:O-antigen/teichoic acid export membrane protein
MRLSFRRLVPMALSYAASTGSLVSANLAQLITFAILARSFGAVEFGNYVAFSAVTGIAVQLCGLGGSESLVRRVAQDPKCYPEVLGHNLILIAITGVILVVIGQITMPLLIVLSPDTKTNLISTFLLLVTNVVLVRVVMLAERIYLGFSRFAEANSSVVMFAIARTTTATVACLAFKTDTIVGWAVWQFACHVLVGAYYGAKLVRIGWPKFVILRDEVRLGILFATPFIFRAIRQNADLMVLGLVTSPEIVASYGIARRITDSSYMAIDALNRIVYPGLAAASLNGIHHAMVQTSKVLVAALGLGITAGLMIFLAAPYLHILFGSQYTSLPFFCESLGWCIVFIALWAVAVDALGAAGRHGPRAWVLNLGNALGAVFIAWATWVAPPMGTIIGNYVIEIGIMIAAWIVLLHIVQRSRNRARIEVTALPVAAE